MELSGGTFYGMIERNDYLTLTDLAVSQGEFKMISFHYQNRDQHFRYVEGSVSRIQLEDGQENTFIHNKSITLKAGLVLWYRYGKGPVQQDVQPDPRAGYRHFYGL